MSSVLIEGRVGNEPEMRFTPSGSRVTNLNIATYAGKEKDGKKRTTWIEVSCWGDLAEQVQFNFSKGNHVVVAGQLTGVRDYKEKRNIQMTAFAVHPMTEDAMIMFRGRNASKGKGNGEVKHAEALA